jgi:hypothetical protein
MPVIQVREPVTIQTVVDDGGPESFIAAILGLIVIAMLGYMIYAFNANAPTVAPEMNAPTVAHPLTPPQTPAPAPSPLPLPMPR